MVIFRFLVGPCLRVNECDSESRAGAAVATSWPMPLHITSCCIPCTSSKTSLAALEVRGLGRCLLFGLFPWLFGADVSCFFRPIFVRYFLISWRHWTIIDRVWERGCLFACAGIELGLILCPWLASIVLNVLFLVLCWLSIWHGILRGTRDV